MIRFFYIICFLCCSSFAFSQAVIVEGKVSANDDVENIHIINKASKSYTTTNALGEFSIRAKLNDTIVFSAVQYKLKAVLVDAEILSAKTLNVTLEENRNELDQVVVGRVLTKDLESDIENSQAKATINFYDVGIPGYQGKQLTHKERLLHEAGQFRPAMLLGLLGGGLPLNPIINGITGRTKKLKNLVKLERRDALMYKIINEYSTIVLQDEEFTQAQKMDYFFFCSEDKEFTKICSGTNGLLILEFLQNKLKTYKQNQKN